MKQFSQNTQFCKQKQFDRGNLLAQGSLTYSLQGICGHPDEFCSF